MLLLYEACNGGQFFNVRCFIFLDNLANTKIAISKIKQFSHYTNLYFQTYENKFIEYNITVS